MAVLVETPMIIRETSQGDSRRSILDEMLLHREVECVGEINANSVYSLCRQLRHLQREDPYGEITMYINSPGGSVADGLALYDVMKGISCPIRTICLGTAASMGTVLFAAGDQRDILPHGRVMIHDPLIGQTGQRLTAPGNQPEPDAGPGTDGTALGPIYRADAGGDI